MAIKQIGYYVEERYFGIKVTQATSYAQNCANTYKRRVNITFVGHAGRSSVVDVAQVEEVTTQA